MTHRDLQQFLKVYSWGTAYLDKLWKMGRLNRSGISLSVRCVYTVSGFAIIPHQTGTRVCQLPCRAPGVSAPTCGRRAASDSHLVPAQTQQMSLGYTDLLTVAYCYIQM